MWFSLLDPFTWVFASDANVKPTVFGYKRHRYEPRNSSTSRNTTDDFMGPFAGGIDTSDIVHIRGNGNLSVRMTFGMADGLNTIGRQIFSITPADGIAGIGEAREGGFLDAFGSSMQRRVVTIWADRNRNASYKVDAEVTFGRLNQKSCDTNWFFVPQTLRDSWATNITGTSIGSMTTARSALISVQPFAAGIVGPSKQLKPLVKLANATVDEYGRYRVDCGKAAVLPNITFHFGEHDLSVPASDYVYKDWTVKDQKLCLLGVAMNGNDASDDSWTLGAVFLSSHCVAYEWDKKKIGFSASKITK